MEESPPSATTGSVVTYIVDHPTSANDVVSRLAARFPIRRGNRAVSDQTYCETFDWRLYQDAGILSAGAVDGAWLLRWDDVDGRSRYRLTLAARPHFARDLGPGRFHDELARVVGVRRLLPTG